MILLSEVKPGQEFKVLRTGIAYKRLKDHGGMAMYHVRCLTAKKPNREVLMGSRTNVELVEVKKWLKK